MWSAADREQRRYSASREDQRSRFERDRDRILYSSAFRRLSGITQIVRAGEADVFHTRQQHTLKVAQVGRRLAQLCEKNQPEICNVVAVHPEVVEAACLAHDLGHPPFGHVGEHVLNELVGEHDKDGFEGNAQSFRILTKLAIRFEECKGLDLTRATLAACLKYPWLREPDVQGRNKKWGAYKSEEQDFLFARELFNHSSKSAEAEIMDWADDIAYSVHDLEDFHRCGAIPWHNIFSSGAEQLVARAEDNWYGKPTNASGRLRDALRRLEEFIQGSFIELISKPYEGTADQRCQLRTMTSKLIGRYIKALSLMEPSQISNGVSVAVNNNELDEVKILKQITRDYIINNPSLAAQQKGQERIVRNLFGMLHEDACKANSYPAYLPIRLRYLWGKDVTSARFAADCIASLTEAETIGLHGRLQGTSSGSVLDPIVR